MTNSRVSVGRLVQTKKGRKPTYGTTDSNDILIKRVKMLLAISVLTLLGLVWYSHELLASYVLRTIPEPVFVNDTELLTVTSWLVNSSSCMLPDFNPWDLSIAHVIGNETPPPTCRRTSPVRLKQQDSLLFMFHNSSTEEQLCDVECCYRSITQADKGYSDDEYVLSNWTTCFKGESVIKVFDEFIKVTCFCKNDSSILLEDFRTFVIPQDNKPTTHMSKKTKHAKLNIYILVLASISRLNFRRFLPDIEQMLNDDFNAIPMLGMNKIGVNPIANLLPLLAGINIDQYEEKIQELPDNLTLIWEYFSELGYATMLNEDLAMSYAFSSDKISFYVAPTNKSSRPINLAIEKSKFLKAVETHCINQRSYFEFQLKWLEDFMAAPEEAPQLAVLVSGALSRRGSLSHIATIQQQLAGFLRRYRQSPRYESSLLMLLSDQGEQHGPIMRHRLGGYESRLPFFFIAPPPWYADQHQERMAALRNNSHRLTTLLDGHATLRQLLQDAGGLRLPATSGVSLFSRLPAERTCRAAGVGHHWCACRRRRPVAADAAAVRRAAAAVVRHINEVTLRPVRSLCAHLSLLDVIGAYAQQPSPAETEDEQGRRGDGGGGGREYVVRFVTMPGLAEFEATVRSGSNGARVVGVSRLDAFASQSSCLSRRQEQEKMFCFCV